MELLIDFSWLWNNRLYAFKDLTTSDGVPTGAMYGVLKFHELIALKGYKIVACLDGEPTERKALFEGYKANRESDDFRTSAKRHNMPLFEVLSHLGWTFLKEDDKEADDLIASRAMQLAQKNEPCIIFSADKDLQQLMVFPAIKISSKIDKGNFVFKTEQDVIDKIGCKPRWARFMRPIRGDSSDSIPSAVPRVQAKVILPVVKDIEDGVMLGLNLPEAYHRAVEKNKNNLTESAYSKFREGITQYCINFQIMDLVKWYHQPLTPTKVLFRDISDEDMLTFFDKYELKELKETFIVNQITTSGVSFGKFGGALNG